VKTPVKRPVSPGRANLQLLVADVLVPDEIIELAPADALLAEGLDRVENAFPELFFVHEI